MTQPACLVTFLLDRSGSMQSCRDSTIEAFNGYLASLAAEREAEISFTLLQFDSQSLDKICLDVPVREAPPLTTETFVPRGGTPLVDAAVKTINAVEQALKVRGDSPKIVICIQTDGHENASREHHWEELRALISRKMEQGWQFTFLGAGINAYDQGAQMGIPAPQTMSYDNTLREESAAAFASVARKSAAYAAGRSRDTVYLAEDRAAAGDRFAPDSLLPPASPQLDPTASPPAPWLKRVAQRIRQNLPDARS